MSHFSSRVLLSSCFLFITMWTFQVSRPSKYNPRYITVSSWGTIVTALPDDYSCYVTWKEVIIKLQDRQCTYDVTLRRVYGTIGPIAEQ